MSSLLGQDHEEDLTKFTEDMRRNLLLNIHKGGWDGESPFYLLRRLNEEVSEIIEVFDRNDYDGIIKECADVANFAMMLAANTRRRRERRPLIEVATSIFTSSNSRMESISHVVSVDVAEALINYAGKKIEAREALHGKEAAEKLPEV